jgi:hypothetical protein
MNVSHTTCLSCNTQSTMPLPPTSISDEPIDGRTRAKRRRQLATTRKVPFHQRESFAAQSDDNGTKGHTLYRKQEAIHNWGELPIESSEQNDTLAEA